MGATQSSQLAAAATTTTLAQKLEQENRQNVYQFTVKDYRGKDLDLALYKGKVLLIVNVASNCGFTASVFPHLVQLHDRFRDKGFEILAFPCNQFLWQQVGSSEHAKELACTRFNVEFPMLKKVFVNGPKTAPIYKFLKASKSGLIGSRIEWNFTRFLIGRDGQVIARYSLLTRESVIEEAIAQALEKA